MAMEPKRTTLRKMLVKMLLRFGFRSKNAGKTDPRREVAYSEPIGSNKSFFIKAIGGIHCAEIGRVVAEPLVSTNCCYVVDILVDPGFRKKGIAKNLLAHALNHSGCSTIVPVSIERDAIAFWSHLALEAQFPVRIGVMQTEVEAIRDAMNFKENSVNIVVAELSRPTTTQE